MGPRIVQFRDELIPAWDKFVDDSAAGWFWHTSAWKSYCLAYAGGHDLSFAVQDSKCIVSICPLILEKDQFSMGGDPCAWPLGNSSGDIQQRISDLMLAEVERLARDHAICRWRYRLSPLVPQCEFDCPEDRRDISWASRIVDLTRDQTKLWADLRSSYHSLIHRAEERLDFHGGYQEPWRFAEYAALHRQLHGGRSDETYALQAEWLTTRDAVVYTAWSKRTGSVVGAAYFNVYKRGAYYGSAAYGEPDIACALIWHAMKDLKRHGIAKLEMGWQGHATDTKGKGVELFKRGFGGCDQLLVVAEKQW